MNIHYLYKIALSCIPPIIIYAADPLTDLVAIEQCKQLSVSNNAYDGPDYIINMQERELISGKTFTELRYNAYHKNIPWIVCPLQIAYPRKPPVILMVDVVEVFKASHMNMCTDFSSFKAVDDSFFKALRICLSQKCPWAKPLYALGYHCIIPQNFEYTSYLCHCITKHGQSANYCDISCALAMVFRNDYTQLLPLIQCLQKVPEKNAVKQFWNNTYNQLSHQQQAILQQIFIAQFSHDIPT